MRSRNDWPGSCVTSITSRSESRRVPPVTAERSPPDSLITGADSPVIADSSTEPTPSMISPSAGITWPATTTTMSPLRRSGAATSSSAPSGELAEGRRCRSRRPQGVRLRLAAAFRDRLGEVGEEDGEPEPDRDRADEPEVPGVTTGEEDEEVDGRDHAADLDDEHDRVPELETRVELRERIADRGERELAGEDARGLPGHYCAVSLSSARLSLRTLTPGSPKKPRLRPSVFFVDQALDGREREVAHGGDSA